MIVAIDAGNTRTKWGVFDVAGSLVSHGAVDNSRLEHLTEAAKSWSDCRRLVLANVAGAAIAERIEALCNNMQLSLLTVTATARCRSLGCAGRGLEPVSRTLCGGNGRNGADGGCLVLRWRVSRRPDCSRPAHDAGITGFRRSGSDCARR